MQVQQTTLSDVFLIKNDRYTDKRGYFGELFHAATWLKTIGKPFSCVQLNQSYSHSWMNPCAGPQLHPTPLPQAPVPAYFVHVEVLESANPATPPDGSTID